MNEKIAGFMAALIIMGIIGFVFAQAVNLGSTATVEIKYGGIKTVEQAQAIIDNEDYALKSNELQNKIVNGVIVCNENKDIECLNKILACVPTTTTTTTIKPKV